MISASPPEMMVKDTLLASCKGIRDPELKRKLLARERDLCVAEQEYLEAAEHDRLYTFARAEQAIAKKMPGPDRDELRDLYDDGLVSRKDGRTLYDKLMAGAPFGRCLLCGNSEVSSLDHHLPKDTLPLYAICPANLVPACTKCNQAKGNRIGATPGQRTLHPYYDRPGETERFLIADVENWNVQFRVEPLPTWSAETSQRVAHHFHVFDLARRYAKFSVSLLISNQWIHRELLRTGGPPALEEHLREDARQHAESHGLNAWDTALRFALANSAWYINHGVNTTI